MRVSLFLDHACNLACGYCYNGRKFQRRMSLEIACRGVDLALSGRGPTRVSFFGGEPLLQMDLIREITTYTREQALCRQAEPGFLIVTNGTLLEGERLQYLIENDVYIGLSLDGTREAHDATRRHPDGRSSWEGVERAVRKVVAAREGHGLRIIAVVDPSNVDHMAASFNAIRALGVRNLSMNLNYEGAWTDGARDRFTHALHELGNAYIDAFRLAARENREVGFQLNLLDSRIITRVKGGYAEYDRCDFGCEEVAVSPRGRLYPCDRLVGEDTRDELVIGDVWQGVDPVRRDALLAQKNRLHEDCAVCALKSRCMHWCGCVNYAMTGRVGEAAGLLCWFEQRLLEEADRCASTLFQEGNAAFFHRFYSPRVVTGCDPTKG